MLWEAIRKGSPASEESRATLACHETCITLMEPEEGNGLMKRPQCPTHGDTMITVCHTCEVSNGYGVHIEHACIEVIECMWCGS